jgi:hypothetical protein
VGFPFFYTISSVLCRDRAGKLDSSSDGVADGRLLKLRNFRSAGSCLTGVVLAAAAPNHVPGDNLDGDFSLMVRPESAVLGRCIVFREEGLYSFASRKETWEVGGGVIERDEVNGPSD